MNELKIEKVDMAMATLSQLPTEERNVIMEGLREIVKMYAENSVTRTSNVAFGWWDLNLKK